MWGGAFLGHLQWGLRRSLGLTLIRGVIVRLSWFGIFFSDPNITFLDREISSSTQAIITLKTNPTKLVEIALGLVVYLIWAMLQGPIKKQKVFI